MNKVASIQILYRFRLPYLSKVSPILPDLYVHQYLRLYYASIVLTLLLYLLNQEYTLCLYCIVEIPCDEILDIQYMASNPKP